MAKRDYYEVLGVSKSAEEKEIKKACLEVSVLKISNLDPIISFPLLKQDQFLENQPWIKAESKEL